MIYRALLRALLAPAAIAAAAALGGCDTDYAGMPLGRALAPLSDKMLADIEAKNMTKESPILVRLFKEESELEVWKEDNTGRFALLKTYPICRWSGELGPKIKLGDRQAPEGFYTIAPGQMNPNSNYYLAINTGFPNAYDRANARTGEFLMIHGDCSSAGCYAMTDEQIGEIYALARESFFGGQKAFQIQAYPFRMTPTNMARHRDSPHMAFWKMIKKGYDHFEVTHQEPKVDVCEKHYVFDAAAPGGGTGALHFTPAAKCPDYEVPQEIAVPVKEKEQRDEAQVAQLIAHGTATVPVRTGTDGGMNPVFLAAVEKRGGTTFPIPASSSLPGTIPANIRPPGPPSPADTTGSTMSLASSESRPAPAPQASAPQSSATQSSATQSSATQSSAPQSSQAGLFGGLFSSSGDHAKDGGSDSQSGGVLDRMSRLVGLGGSSAPDTAPPQSKPAAKPTKTAAATPARSKPNPTATANAAPAKPQASPQPQTSAETQQEAVNTANLLRGAQATVPTGSFDSRWGAMH